MEEKGTKFETIEVDEEIEVNGGNSILGIGCWVELAKNVLNALLDSKEKP